MGRRRRRYRRRTPQFVSGSHSQRRSRSPTRGSCSTFSSPRWSRSPTRRSCSRLSSPRYSRSPTRRSYTRSRSPRYSRTPTRRSYTISRSPSLNGTPTRRSCSRPRRHLTTPWRRRSPRSRWRSSRRISRSRSCPLLHPTHRHSPYGIRCRATLPRYHSSEIVGRRYYSLSPDRLRRMKYSKRSRSSSLSNSYISDRSSCSSGSVAVLWRRTVSRIRSRYRRHRSRSYSYSSGSAGVLSSRSVSRSCSRSRSPQRRSRSPRRSRSGSIKRDRRCRSRSITRYRRSRSRSCSYSSGSAGVLSSRSVSRSCSRSRSPQRRSRSPRRSRSGSIKRDRRSRSRSITRYRRSRSRSITRYRRSRSRSITRRSRSRTRYRRSRSRSISPYGRDRSRSSSLRRRRRIRRRRYRRRTYGSRLSHKRTNACDTENTNTTLFDIDQNVSDFFFANASTDEHIKAQNQNRSRYIAGITLLHQKGTELHQRVRVRALAASWARNDFKLSTEFLRDRDRYGVMEILKALQVLDSGRRIRQGERNLKRLQMGTGKVSRDKINKLKCKINGLRKIQPKLGSAGGSVCKNVRTWTKTLSRGELEWCALHLPKEPWRKLADICHFNPVEDFPNLPWFLSYCFGKPAPCGTVVHTCEDLNKTNINDKLKTCDIPYGHSRKFKKYLSVEAKIKIATSEPQLDTVLWYYEELECRQVDEIIMQRLDTGDTSNLPIGKLMDRLISLKELARGFRCGRRTTRKYSIPFMKTLMSLAESKLQNVKLKLDSPVVVLGDRSASMDIAVRTSSVIAGILCSICSADLVVFNSSCKRPKTVPANVDEVLKLAMKTVACGATNPSSALKPFYKRKRIVKTFIVVTDEEENMHDFADLFEKYHSEVYPASLVFVSFLNQHEKGDMCSKLMERGFNPLQFVLDAKRPDLTKLEKLFGILASKSISFTEELSILQNNISGTFHDSNL